MMQRLPTFWLVFIIVWALSACQVAPAAPAVETEQEVSVAVTQQPLTGANACSGTFVRHQLPFATGTRLREINTYESNGAGVAVNDLDGDGDLDLVFASIDREAVILWNQGNLQFEPQPLGAEFTRAVNTVDVDGDGALDIVFTHRGLDPPSYWRNVDGEFVETPLKGVTTFAYTMAWADLNKDGRLDLVTGSYNVDLRQQGIADPSQEPNAGIHYYAQGEDGAFTGQVLTPHSEALAIGLVDLNHDGALDIWVANDFVVQDNIWLYSADSSDPGAVAWVADHPFGTTSHSTMSIDWGDIANSGDFALFTTDMNPEDISVEVLAAWLPVIAKLEQPQGGNNPQIMQNVLQWPIGAGSWRNRAPASGIDATGWSWASRFGDLDNDGALDLYIVNGMIAENLFGHLPHGELVEANHAFRNRGDGRFAPAPEWQLDSTASGRGMIMADLDNDGDLDIVINNLRSAAELFENQLCGGASLQVALHWPSAANTQAIGAQVRLRTEQGSYLRDVRASTSYLSGEAARVHFGFPAEQSPIALEILWPDGGYSIIEDAIPNVFLEVSR
jgi:hypothetical protein